MTKFSCAAVVACAALLSVSCSDDNELKGTETELEKFGVKVTSVTDASLLSSRVTNHKEGTSRAVATDDILESYGIASMPDQPAIPEDAIDVENIAEYKTVTGYNEEKPVIGNLESDKNYVVKKDGKRYFFYGWPANAKIYVEGKLIIQNLWGANGAEIYILEGGSVEWANSSTDIANGSTLTYYNYGTFTTANDEISISYNTAFFNDGNWGMGSKKLSVQGRFFVDGKLQLANLSLLSGSRVNVTGDLRMIDGDVIDEDADPENVESEALTDLSVDGILNVGGRLWAKNLTIINSGKLYSGCSVRANSTFKMNSNGTEAHIQYLKADSIYQCAGSTVYLENNGVLYCTGGYVTENSGNGSNIVLEGDNAIAAIQAKTMMYNSYQPMFLKTPGNNSLFVLDCYKFYYYSNSANECGKDDVEFANANVVYGSEVKFEIEADGCNFDGYKSTGNEAIDSPKLDLISTIEYDHTHDISATCIQSYNGKLYASYHERGEGFAGCVEVFTPSATSTTLNQYVEAKDEIEFNHLCVDASNSRVILAGSSNAKGAMIATVDIVDGGLLNTSATEIDTDTYEPLQVVAMEKPTEKTSSDANAVIIDGDNVHVAWTGGYKTLDINSIETETASVSTKDEDEKAKHIAISGSTIAGLRMNASSGAAEVDIFNAGSIEQASSTFAVGTIEPLNGKNVVAIDGSDIYVCLGENGFACYDKSGTMKWSYAETAEGTENVEAGSQLGSCNGCAFDSNYIYLAYGSRGLVVIDKEGNKVTRKSAGENSANYVCLDSTSGNIFVAYGKDRIQAFKLVARY